MGLFGQGRPIAMLLVRGGLVVMLAAACAFSCAVASYASELDVRLRFAWGSGGQSPQKWTGKITVAGATLSELQPLGIEADEAAALRLVGNEIRVTPLVRRAFDGCDVTVQGNEAAIVKVELQCSPDAAPKVIEAPLGQVAKEQFRATLDDLGGDLLIHRAPGDRLRVHFDRPHLVFNPAEELNLNVAADLKGDAGDSPITVVATLRRVGEDKIIKQLQAPYDPATNAPIAFALEAPSLEGAYRISLAAQRKTGLAGRLVPWEKNNVIASREVEFVVVDPEARLPRLTDAWETVATIDPTSSSWWQRAPHWTQFDKLPGFSTPRPLGNVRPTPVPNSPLGLVELPAEGPKSDSINAPTAAEPAWQAYVLSVHRVDEPHAVEIEIPRGRRQHLGVSIIEPDAAGRVTTFGRDSGVYNDHVTSEVTEAGVEVHRVVFWPRTKSPALLLTNRSPSRAVQYGKIRLLHRVSEPAVADVSNIAGGGNERLVAAYIASPRLAETLGGAEELDPQSGVSVDGWITFLTAANRLAQQLRAGGYNAAIVSVAAEGACLAPIDALGASRRFDTGLLSASGADPVHKDVLEVLFRVFDREGLRLVPAVQLTAPLPALESLADRADIRHRNHDGQTWAQHSPTEAAAAPHYNILHNEVQMELSAVVDQLVTRYGNHPSFAGLSIQLSGEGYGLLPGLAWGMDDATVGRFASKHGLDLPGEGPTRFRQRAALLLGKHLPEWKQWRQDELTGFYRRLAARVADDASERQLIVATESLFSGPIAAERVRQAVGGRASINDALDEVGLDVKQLAAMPGITVLRPRRLAAEESVDARAMDHRINSALELDQALAGNATVGELLYHTSSRLRLSSFDAQSPFGADRTRLVLSSHSTPAGDAARQPLAAALNSRDTMLLATGADCFPLADSPALVEALRTFQELPLAASDVRTVRRQPVTLRVYREAQSTTLCLINESRWPVNVSIPLDAETDLAWRRLGVEAVGHSGSGTASTSDTKGTLARGHHKLELTLPPYALHARRFSSHDLRIGDFAPQLGPEAADEMARRVREIEYRMAGLNVERAYNELQNPNFELVDDGGQLRGWQPRMGQRGAVEVSVDPAPGSRSVHLRSEDALGVAVQSHLFATPSTGQLVVRAKVRAASLQPGAHLYAWIEYESGGAMRQRPVLLGDHSLPATWTETEFAVDDLPLAAAGKMRIHFHLTGSGEAWVDEVRLYDLRFADAQRVELSKRLLGAKAALDEGHLMDCQRLVDGYLPRRLVEHIPPPALASKPTDVTPTAAADKQEDKGLGPRIRGIVPKILR